MGKVKQKIYAIALVSVESKSLDSVERSSSRRMPARGWTEQQGEMGGERVMEACEAGRKFW